MIRFSAIKRRGHFHPIQNPVVGSRALFLNSKGSINDKCGEHRSSREKVVATSLLSVSAHFEFHEISESVNAQ